MAWSTRILHKHLPMLLEYRHDRPSDSHSVLKDVDRFVSALLLILSALLAFPSARLVFLETSGLNSVQKLHVIAAVSCEVRTRRAVMYFCWW